MKLLVLIAMLAGLAQNASADIRIPGSADRSSATYSGETAKAKFNSIQSQVIRGSSSGWTGATESFKVERSADGLVQTVCAIRGNYRTQAPPQYSCTVEKSLNGQPLPVFKVHIRMG